MVMLKIPLHLNSEARACIVTNVVHLHARMVNR